MTTLLWGKERPLSITRTSHFRVSGTVTGDLKTVVRRAIRERR